MNDNPLKPKVIPSPINPTGEQANTEGDKGRFRVAYAEQIEWLKRLTTNEDFRRFVKVMQESSLTSRRKLGEIEKLTTEQRVAYGHKLVAELDAAQWADEQLSFCTEKLKALDEHRPVQP